MTGSHRYLDALESLHTMLASYPTQAELSAIQLAVDPAGRVSVVVHLRVAEPATLAAGLVEWRRSLGRPEVWAWRTPEGNELHIAVVGHGDEFDDDVPIAVLAGPTPYDRRLDHGLDPGAAERLSGETLDAWLAAEVVRTWPFSSGPTADKHTGATL